MGFDFYKLVEESFSFLESNGFKPSFSKPVKGESSVSYTSNNLVILLFHESYSNVCWCDIGDVRDHCSTKWLSLCELIDFHGVDIQLSNSPDVYLSQLAVVLQSELVTLTQDNTILLEPIWAEKDNSENTLYEYQNSKAFRIVKIGKAEILELPNTKKALGEEYIEQFPNHDFSLDKVWLARTKITSSVCDSIDQAREFVMAFGE